ncbi:hypothetical protein FRZ03_01040 [Streptomyces misionensis]|uniref:Uncharacterized protein n=1 Tax=Streptomyces misionensis TaxID=67331 RepID=A0A5C6K6I5_9ACTN|nr:hypothetical protein FRZ03_01040 [Streptomyces misionensis]
MASPPFAPPSAPPSSVGSRSGETRWWPLVVAVERVVDATTAVRVRAGHGAPSPDPNEVGQVASPAVHCRGPCAGPGRSRGRVRHRRSG